MNTFTTYYRGMLGLAMVTAFATSGCSGMTQQEKGAATGAIIGGVAGNALCNGGLLCTGAGAAVGGVVGNEVSKPK